MAENIARSTGRPQEYKFDRGGTPAEMGPYIGIVVNNVDNTRQGRLQVWIEQFGATEPDGSPNLTDPTVWRTVRYCPPFYGATKQSGAAGYGTFPGNRNSYGMWFTPPDLGTRVLCFFVGGDPSVGGYYVGCIPEDGMNHMIPAIGASSNYQAGNATQSQLLKDVPVAPVTEINDINAKISDNPRFFAEKKPVQSVVAGILYQQGLNKDLIRGPIRSSSQRESPSNCYGISTPGKAIYQGGLTEKDIKAKLEKDQVKLTDIAVIGRQGGHTFVMDDGDLEGKDNLVRIRTAKGHQITMSDDGDAFFITHANGQTWIELGKAGTVDVYSTNSINLRSAGQLNFHADKGINMFSGGGIRMKSTSSTLIETAGALIVKGDKAVIVNSKKSVGIRSEGSLALQGTKSSWKGGSTLNLKGDKINLNGASTIPVSEAPSIPTYKLADTVFEQGTGWTIKPGLLETTVTRAPTHEPYQYHSQGANSITNLNPIVEKTLDPASPTAKSYEQISTAPVKTQLTVANLLKETGADTVIGNLTQGQLTALTAATAAAKDFPAYDDDGNLMPGWQLNEDNDPVYTGPELGIRGVGIYGQTPEALVSAGYLKPAVLSLISSAQSVASVLSSDTAWTGQFGIDSLLGYLDSPILQNAAQLVVMAGAFAGLIDSGILNGDEEPRVQATFLEPATEIGVTQVVQFVQDEEVLPVEVRVAIIESARRGQYAIDFAAQYQELLLAQVAQEPVAVVVEREIIDEEVGNFIDNPKIDLPQYTDVPVVITPEGAQSVTPATRILANVVTTTGKEDGTLRFSSGNNNG